jgi:hypothetical protein
LLHEEPLVALPWVAPTAPMALASKKLHLHRRRFHLHLLDYGGNFSAISVKCLDLLQVAIRLLSCTRLICMLHHHVVLAGLRKLEVLRRLLQRHLEEGEGV